MADTIMERLAVHDAALTELPTQQDLVVMQNQIAALQPALALSDSVKAIQAQITGLDATARADNIRAMRNPDSTDVYDIGKIWRNESFGVATPLLFASLGGGGWVGLNQFSLSKIRFYCSGISSTYRSCLTGITLYKADGVTPIPNNWFVVGASSVIGGFGAAGATYAGQNCICQYNGSGFSELNVSALFDAGISIGKITGSASYASAGGVEFWYTHGGRQVSSTMFTTFSPAIACRHGSVPAVAPSRADFDLLAARMAALEARMP